MHRSTSEDEVGKDPKEGKDDNENHPERLGDSALVMTSEYVGKDRDGEPDPKEEEEELEHRPKNVEERVVGCKHLGWPFVIVSRGTTTKYRTAVMTRPCGKAVREILHKFRERPTENQTACSTRRAILR